MIVKEILKAKIDNGQTKVCTINENKTAYEAVKTFDQKKIGALIVVDNEENVVGIITEKDVLYKCYDNDTKLTDKAVKALMTGIDNIIIGNEDDDTDYLKSVMNNKNIRHIPIFDADNELVGIISIRDINKVEIANKRVELKLLREHIQNPYGVHIYK
ncbi:MAG: CBS domain-containing protein [Bacteroidota bacterium]